MQRIDHPDPDAANREARHEIANGATGLSLVFAGAIGSYGYGLAPDAQALARVLDGIDLEGIVLDLDISEPSKQAADHVAALVQKRGVAPSQVTIRFGHDPIGAHALIGAAPLRWSDLAPRFAAHVAALGNAGFAGPLTVADGRVIHNAGGSEAQELGFVLAVAVAYLRAFEAAGMELGQARSMIAFRLSADAEQFLTMAKFRALRKLWARVEEACGLAPKPAFIAAETAWRMMTQRDPHVNMLRATIATVAAGLAGADAITVLPFTAALGLPDRFARRIARNMQLILLQESNLARVGDPAAGSGGIEALTDALCSAAWKIFQAIEAAGGIMAALEQGLVQRDVARTRAAHEGAVATRKQAITGTSEFPNLAEAPAVVVPATPISVAAVPAALAFEPLPPMRFALPFERLRDASDQQLAETGSRPHIFLANLGTPAEFTPRMTFAMNFFEAGGIEAAGNDGFADLAALVLAFMASGSQFACLCGSDEAYARDGVAAARALDAAGCAHIYLAGKPKDQAALRAAGVTEFVFTGCDALATLEAAHAKLGLR